MVSILLIFCLTIGTMSAASQRIVPEQSLRRFPVRGTNPGKSWLSVAIMLLQENQKIKDKLEQVKTHNEIENTALRQAVEILNQKIQSQPKSTRCYMGMKFGDIPDSALSASSHVDYKHHAARARLDTEMSGDNFRGGWAASTPVMNEWIEVDLGTNTSIAGVILQGRSDINEWVKTYKVQCDSITVQDYGMDKIFIGNNDRNSKVVEKFPKPLSCQVIRIVPITFKVHVTLRFELIRGHCFDEY